jgi:hypothetical protein
MLKKDGTEIAVENHPPPKIDGELTDFFRQFGSDFLQNPVADDSSSRFAEVTAMLEAVYEETWCKVRVWGNFSEEVTFRLISSDESWYPAIALFLQKHIELNRSLVSVYNGKNVVWDKLSTDYILDTANAAVLSEKLKLVKLPGEVGMVYVTGDIHGSFDIHKLTTDAFPEQKQMSKQGFLIICGDFGLVWDGDKDSKSDKYWLNWLEKKPFTTLFVDGNHENHPLLNSYPVQEFCGGRAHKISESIYHLMRGEVYTICGKKFFAFGGAASHDKEFRKEGISWWPEEMPTEEDCHNAVEHLTAHDWKVDFIITHCCADSVQDKISGYYKHDALTEFFEKTVKKSCSFEQWYFGHYHISGNIDEKYFCLFDKIKRVI